MKDFLGLAGPFDSENIAGLKKLRKVESGFEFGSVGEPPSINVIENSLIFGEFKGVFFEESVGRRRKEGVNTQFGGKTFTKLGFANPQFTLECENQRETAS